MLSYIVIIETMHRKRKSNQYSLYMPDQKKCSKHANPSKEEEELSVTIMMGAQRSPVTVQVPRPCNMKILKSIIWFHLKKIMTIAEYSQIVGFETTPTDYQRDYQLHQGLGELDRDINLSCFYKQGKYPLESLLNYKICKLISVGGFSKVYLLRNLTTGDFLTGKFILKENANLDLVTNEYQIARTLDHPYIVKTHQFIETDHFYIILMEFVSGGELFELLKEQRTMNEECARFYIVETLQALKYLHDQNIIYRDIKPENIILDHEGHLKLTDFGLAKRVDGRSYSFCGSIDYMAPEILEEDGYSFEVDYYSIGNLLFQLLVGSPPFYHPKFTHEQTKFHIKNTPVRFSDKIFLTEEAKSLLSNLLEKDSEKRLGRAGGVDQILTHPWFASVDLESFAQRNEIPPFETAIKMEVPPEETKETIHEWSFFIERDIKKMQIKATYHTKKHTIVNRRSVDSQKDHRRLSQKYSHQASPQGVSPSKLKSNFSLLHVLTHKRSTSEFPCKNNPHFYFKDKEKKTGDSVSLFRSVNNSRKTSLHRQASAKRELCNFKQISQPSLKNAFVLHCGKKNKQNGGFIKKRKKEGLQFCKI